MNVHTVHSSATKPIKVVTARGFFKASHIMLIAFLYGKNRKQGLSSPTAALFAAIYLHLP